MSRAEVMTARERTRIAEILRCAADLVIADNDPFPVLLALRLLGCDINNPIYDLVYAARTAVGGVNNQWQLLEAAMRVEEGWNP